MKKPRTIRSLFITNFLLFSIIPLLLFGIAALWGVTTQFTHEITKRNFLLAKTVMVQIERVTETAEQVVRHVAEVITETRVIEEQSINTYLNEVVSNSRTISAVSILDHSGIIRFHAPRDNNLVGRDISERTFIENAESEEPFWSPSFISDQTHTPTIAFSFPTDRYIFVGYTDLDFLNTITDNIRLEKTGYVFVTDKNGTFIAHRNHDFVHDQRNLFSRLPELAEQREAEQTVTRLQGGVPLITSVVTSKKLGWMVGITQNRKEAYSTVIFLIFVLSVAVLASAFFAVITAIVNQRRLFTPITSLIETTTKIANGDYRPEEIGLEDAPPPLDRIAETEVLRRALRSMCQAIKKREEKLHQSEEKYRDLVQSANSIMIRWDKNLCYTFFNEYAEWFFGYSQDEVLGKSLVGITVPETSTAGEDLEAMLEDIVVHPERYYSNENEVLKQDGTTGWMQWSNKPIYDEEGNLAEILSIGTDRTEYKKKEEQIAASLNEKETLLKEIHHRVKNNMQVISSLLNLQAGHVADPADFELFRESQMRVQTMALIHEQLYQSEQLSNIDFGEYIRDLVGFLSDSYNITEREITFSITTDTVHFSIEKAIPCALIINELVSNSIKHAFPDMSEGKRPPQERVISIDLLRRNGQYALKIEDNGVGLPEELDLDAVESMGFQLVATLAEQLEGNLTVRKSPSAVFELCFSE
jgi:PAS domain S-box-containing protein